MLRLVVHGNPVWKAYASLSFTDEPFISNEFLIDQTLRANPIHRNRVYVIAFELSPRYKEEIILKGMKLHKPRPEKLPGLIIKSIFGLENGGIGVLIITFHAVNARKS